MNAQLTIRKREVLLILAGLLVAFYAVKSSSNNAFSASEELSIVENSETYYLK